jgi:2-iminobutanoate/2-iminopropanoate deaminase
MIGLIHTDMAPNPTGHYSQGVVHQGTVYVAGQLPLDPKDPDARLGDVETQTRQVLANVEQVLLASGASLDTLLQVTIYVTDLVHWPEINRIYADVLGTHRPARAVVPCGPLRHGALLEIVAIGAVVS